MADPVLLLLGISAILFFGFFAELIFKKFYVPDILFLIGLGFLLGPHGLDYLGPAQLSQFAPLFTTFALFFLVYNGAFNIDIASFAKGLKKGVGITFYNFILSVCVIFTIIFLFTKDTPLSLLTAFIMSGVSSAFVIPIINQIRLKTETYSALMIEATLTDVFTIVFSIAMMELIALNVFDAQAVVTNLISLFAVAGLLGIVAAAFWIFLTINVFKEQRFYMLTIAYLILLYALTESLGGSGVIAALFFGLMLRNSKQFISAVGSLLSGGTQNVTAVDSDPKSHADVISKDELFFYSQISFFLKTFFFVYVGLLLNLSDEYSLGIAFIISAALMMARASSQLVTTSMSRLERGVVSSMFARGVAAAAIAQEVVTRGIPNAELIVNVTYAVIAFTIVFSSLNIFISRRAFECRDDGTGVLVCKVG